MSTPRSHGPQVVPSRRQFMRNVGDGLFGAALAYLAGDAQVLGKTPDDEPHRNLQHGVRRSFDLTPKQPHFPTRAKAVIHLCMQGGPSQVDTFDPKPALQKYNGQTPPSELTKNAVFANDRTGKLLASPWRFKQHGASGAWVSDLLPNIAQHVDSMAIIRSMFNVHPNHEPAIYKYQSGQTFPGHPVFGSWIVYGLGSVNQSLPAYVVLADPIARLPTNGVENWMSGYLPPLYQGTPMRGTGSPLLNLTPQFSEPQTVTETKRRLIARLDELHKRQRPQQMELDARIRNYELAARMQVEATNALEMSGETTNTLDSYGIGQKDTDNFGRRCLLARRLVERGVRFVQVYPRGQMWDNHRDIRKSLRDACRNTDLPIAGLLGDLKRRGLLDSTLVIWGGEFGRLPTAQVQSASQIATAGRDHGPYGFTSWMAGAGIKPGVVYGATDEIGYAAVENRVSIQDFHATILHLVGLDHDRLSFDRNGLDEKLTHQFETNVVQGILA